MQPEDFIPASRQILLRHKLDVSIELFSDLLVVFAGSAVEDEGRITGSEFALALLRPEDIGHQVLQFDKINSRPETERVADGIFAIRDGQCLALLVQYSSNECI